jgi:hypothetical protein
MNWLIAAILSTAAALGILLLPVTIGPSGFQDTKVSCGSVLAPAHVEPGADAGLVLSCNDVHREALLAAALVSPIGLPFIIAALVFGTGLILALTCWTAGGVEVVAIVVIFLA